MSCLKFCLGSLSNVIPPKLGQGTEAVEDYLATRTGHAHSQLRSRDICHTNGVSKVWAERNKRNVDYGTDFGTCHDELPSMEKEEQECESWQCCIGTFLTLK